MRVRAIVEMVIDCDDEPEWDVEWALERVIQIYEVIDVKILEEMEN